MPIDYAARLINRHQPMHAAAYFDLARPTGDSSNIMGVVDFRERLGLGDMDDSMNEFIVQLIEGAESAIQTFLGLSTFGTYLHCPVQVF